MMGKTQVRKVMVLNLLCFSRWQHLADLVWDENEVMGLDGISSENTKAES